MSNFDLLGSDVSSLDLDCQKLTDGVKSSAGSIDFDSVVNFYSNSAFNNAENGAKFSNQNTVDFDLGQPKTIVEVNAYSSAGLTGRYAGLLGHIGKCRKQQYPQSALYLRRHLSVHQGNL